MTPAEFKQAREYLGLTQAALAVRLGLSVRSGGRTVRRYENGDRAIPGPVALLLQRLIGGD